MTQTISYRGVESVRLTASGLVLSGVPVVLYGISALSDGVGAGNVQWYDDTSAAAASRRGGLTTPGASSWGNGIGFRQRFDQLYVELGANIDEVIVHCRRR